MAAETIASEVIGEVQEPYGVIMRYLFLGWMPCPRPTRHMCQSWSFEEQFSQDIGDLHRALIRAFCLCQSTRTRSSSVYPPCPRCVVAVWLLAWRVNRIADDFLLRGTASLV